MGFSGSNDVFWRRFQYFVPVFLKSEWLGFYFLVDVFFYIGFGRFSSYKGIFSILFL